MQSQQRVRGLLACITHWHRTALVAAMLMTPVPGVAATDCVDRMAQMVGTWRARGAFQRDPDAAREPFRCDITFSSTGPNRVETTGRCATSAEIRDVTGWLTCEGQKFSGPMFYLAGEETPGFIRDMSDDSQISLLLQGADPTTGKTERYRLNTKSLTSDTMEMRITKGAWTALTLRFSRQRP